MMGSTARRVFVAMGAFRAGAVAAAVCVVVCLGSCAKPAAEPTSGEADLAAITDFNRRYVQAINDGDIATLSGLTTAGHIMLSPNRPPRVGKEANDAANGRAFETFDFEESWAPVETVVDGDLAYQRGTYRVISTPKAGGDTRDTTGNFLRIYRRQPDGSWRMTRDMFNSDRPPLSTQ